jgi:tetratricopeptide (TPR) repeat protein
MPMGSATSRRAPLSRPDGLVALAVAAAAFAAFAPALRCGFVGFDDPYYVLNNPYVREGLSAEGTVWAFTTFYNANWHPLTWLSLQLDAALWSVDARGFHLTNVLLHAANAVFLFLALRSLTGCFWRSVAVALLFAVHPLRAESVAWVSERKDVLSACFGLLALLAYAGYARAPSAGRYLPVAVLLALSLLAKPMLVTLPCLLLVLDGWPLRRARTLGDWGKLVSEKLPLFALVAASCVVTVRAQAGSAAVVDTGRFPVGERLENAAVGYAFYLAKTAWPVDLAVFYPHPGAARPARVAAGAALLLAALTAGAVALRRRAPYLLAGWLWYLGTLVPVIGLVQVGLQAYADRYTYLPQVGLLLAACWGVADLTRARPRAALAGAGAAAVLLAALTWNQLAVWHDSVSLWEHDLRVAGPSFTALVDLGEALEAEGRVDRAEECFREALRLDPGSALALVDLAGLLSGQGKQDGAQKLLEEARQLAPDFGRVRSELGVVLYRRGKLEEAAREIAEAVRLAPGLSEAHCNLGLVEAARHNDARAADCFRQALRLRPDSPAALSGLGRVLIRQGKAGEGLACLRAAVRLNPKFVDGHINLGKALAEQGDLEGAARHFAEATRLDPGQAAAWYNLGAARFGQGRLAEAADGLERAVQLDPSSEPYRDALEKVLQALSEAGREDLARAVRERLSGRRGASR